MAMAPAPAPARALRLQSLFCVATAAFLHPTTTTTSPRRRGDPVPPAAALARHGASSPVRRRAVVTEGAALGARPKSKWDDLVDEDDEDDAAGDDRIPADMQYTEANIQRQADNYNRLEAVGGEAAVKDVYVRTPGQKEWWLLGKIAHISDVSTEQAIARQWPLIERHAWAIRVPERPLADLGKPFEVWYAPGHTELSASLNNPSVEFTRARDPETGGSDVQAAVVGFVGKVYNTGEDDPVFFVERNVADGSCLEGMEVQGDWVQRPE